MELAQGIECFAAAGEQFMDVTLMTDIPYYLVFRAIEDTVQSYSQLNDTKVGS